MARVKVLHLVLIENDFAENDGQTATTFSENHDLTEFRNINRQTCPSNSWLDILNTK